MTVWLLMARLIRGWRFRIGPSRSPSAHRHCLRCSCRGRLAYTPTTPSRARRASSALAHTLVVVSSRRQSRACVSPVVSPHYGERPTKSLSGRCTEAPDDASSTELVGDPGMKNGAKKARGLLTRCPLWRDTESRNRMVSVGAVPPAPVDTRVSAAAPPCALTPRTRLSQAQRAAAEGREVIARELSEGRAFNLHKGPLVKPPRREHAPLDAPCAAGARAAGRLQTSTTYRAHLCR